MTSPWISPFIDASALLRPNPAEFSYGCLIADLDRDGLPELLVVTVHGANRLYKWKGDRLIDTAPPSVRDEEASGIGVACADFTGNGFLDLYLLNTSTFLGPYSDPDRLLVNEGGLAFVDVLRMCPERNIAAGRSVVWFDPEGAGRYAAFVCNYAAPCRLYSQNAHGELLDIAPALGLDVLTGGRSALAADFFGTGRMDLFMGNENDQNRFFRNEGAGRFREAAAELGLDDPHCHARGVTLLDFDRDGRLDLALANWEGPHRLFHQTPRGGFTDVAPRALARPSRARTLIAFDYDNDGWEDLFINNNGEPNRLLHNNGDGTFSEVELGGLALPEGLGTGAAVGDLNGDGFLDLFISHGEVSPQPNALFLNSPNGNRWLRVHPQTPQGAPAIGARVTLYAEGDPRPMTRILDGGSGYLCQMEPVAHFGLGQARRAERIEIQLTTGRRLTLEGVEANQNVFARPSAGEGWIVDSIPYDDI